MPEKWIITQFAAGTADTAGMTGLFGPPKALDGRIRWLFLILGVGCLLAVLPRVATGSTAPPAARMAAAVSAVALGAWWLSRYRRETFPPWSALPEAAALGVIGLGLHDWVATLGLPCVCVAYRGLYGPWRHVVGYTLAVLTAATVVVLLTEPGAL